MDKPSAILPGALEQLRLNENAQPAAKKALGQEEFLDLMVAQLQNQDPFNPMESGDFLGQIAQFSTVSGISGLQTSFNAVASSLQSSQALQASTMVGRSVVLPGNTISLEQGEPTPIAANLEQAVADVRLTVVDDNGQIVARQSLGPREAGRFSASWNGLTADGQQAPDGNYQVSLTAVAGSTEVALQPEIVARVDSVSLPRDGQEPVLNVANRGAVAISDVLEIL